MHEHEAVNADWRPHAPFLTGVMERVLWRVNRLRCMPPAEIRHRALRALAMQAERWGLLGSAVVPPPDLAHASRSWIHAAAEVDRSRYLAAADRIAAGKSDVFAMQGIELGSPPRWNRDPKT